jgi:uncharacterized membrane protein YagU involved in acid resistance
MMIMLALGLFIGFIAGISSARSLKQSLSKAVFEINFPPR